MSTEKDFRIVIVTTLIFVQSEKTLVMSQCVLRMEIKIPRHLERFSFSTKKKRQGVSDITVFSVHVETVLRFRIIHILSVLKTFFMVLPRQFDKARKKNNEKSNQ